MTTIPYNQARTCIEDALASAGYGEKMITLADQYRREGNHGAATAAFMTTWQIHGNVARIIETLPRLTPEHAALMTQSERQNLTNGLTASSEKLGRLLETHALAENQPNHCDSTEAEWYMLCLNVGHLGHLGHLAHLARSVAARVERLPESEELLDLAQFSVRHCREDAQDTLEQIRDQEPPADTPFPQTRGQTRDQALRDHAELENLFSRIREKHTGVRDKAANSTGRCHLCSVALRASEVRAHMERCILRNAMKTGNRKDLDERYARNGAILLWVRSEGFRHWMMLAVRPTTSLRQLDRFLRDRWLECCGHMSHFQIGNVQYGACVPSPGDVRHFDADLAEPDARHMVYTLEKTIASGRRFRHEFDYDDTTCLDLEHVAVLTLPYGRMPDLVERPRDPEGHYDDFITIMARNRPPERCFTCGEVAHWRYHENPYVHVPPEHGGLIVTPPYFCDDCALDDVPMAILRNSLRAGVSCYDNTHGEPREDPVDE